MLPKLKTIYRPGTLDKARELLARPDLKIMALYGGPELFDDIPRTEKIEAVVLMADLGLRSLTQTEQGTRLEVMLPLGALPEGDLLVAAARSYPLNLRNMWTVGAVVAYGGATSPFLVTLIALNARVELAGKIDIPLSHYLFKRAPTDIITAVLVPPVPGRVVYESVGRTPADEPIVCAAALGQVGAHGYVQTVGLALGGVDKAPVQAGQVESALLAGPATAAAVSAAVEQLDALEPPGDFRGSSEYRREMAKVLSRRALRRAFDLTQ